MRSGEDRAIETGESPLRWGIIGPGKIARPFCEGIQRLPDARVTAVGSRSPDRAAGFADAFNIPGRHGSYEELVRDPDVDAVYIATPHPMHRDCMLLAIRAGKPVLCEKPFTVNAAEARQVVTAARAAGVFVMEAMKTRFFPAMRQIRDRVAAGDIGEPRLLQADFGFRAGFDPAGRLFDPALGGGALLDVGVYCVSLASLFFGGGPEQVTGLAHLGETGVDEQAAMVLGYSGGRLAVLSTAIRTSTANEVTLFGTEGWIRIHRSAWGPRAYTLYRAGQKDGELVEVPTDGNGFDYEADEVARCLRAGTQESDLMPLDETVQVMETMDRLRAQWGLRYPMEEK
jgi:predicted dehydrogenase